MTTQQTNLSTRPIQLHLGRNEISITPEHIPSLSPTLQFIFTESHREHREALSYPLRGKVDTLSHSLQKLERYQNSSIKDKIYGCIRSAFYIGLATAGILGTAATTSVSTGLAAAVGVASYLLCFGIASYYMSRLGIAPSQSLLEYTSALWAPIVAPLLPLYEEFSKISRSVANITSQKQEIEAKIATLESFFKTDLSQVRNDISQELRIINESLISTPDNQELIEKQEQYSKSLEELDKATIFYSNLIPT